jgi:two-component system, chemotaxis family, chemotaxis protein CheY
MVKLFCHCGYPIWVSARWNSSDIMLLLHDGQQEPKREAVSLEVCPHCHQRLTPADLTWLAPPSSRWQEQAPAFAPSKAGARRRGKILVVDDDEGIRTALQEVLADAGFQVQGAGDGMEALELLRRESGWMVLLDIMMPRLDGRQVLQRLQQEPALRKDNKVVLMSAGWRLDSEGLTLRSEIVVASLRTPVDLEELLALARHLAEGGDGQAGKTVE